MWRYEFGSSSIEARCDMQCRIDLLFVHGHRHDGVLDFWRCHEDHRHKESSIERIINAGHHVNGWSEYGTVGCDRGLPLSAIEQAARDSVLWPLSGRRRRGRQGLALASPHVRSYPRRGGFFHAHEDRFCTLRIFRCFFGSLRHAWVAVLEACKRACTMERQGVSYDRGRLWIDIGVWFNTSFTCKVDAR